MKATVAAVTLCLLCAVVLVLFSASFHWSFELKSIIGVFLKVDHVTRWVTGSDPFTKTEVRLKVWGFFSCGFSGRKWCHCWCWVSRALVRSEFTDLTYLINHRVISDDLDFISVFVHTGYCSAACNLITLQYQCVVAQPSCQSDTLLFHSCTHPQCESPQSFCHVAQLA